MPREQPDIRHADLNHAAAALELALAALPHAQTLAADLRRRAHAEPRLLHGLLAAYRGPQLVGAMLVELQAGQIAECHLPRLAAGEPTETAQSLMHAATAWLDEEAVAMTQLLAIAVSAEEENLLRANQFAYLSELNYLVCSEEHFPRSKPADSLQWTAQADGDPRLPALVEATYEGTRDYPQLNGLREIADVLDGYRATGQMDSALWLIAEHQGRPAGCVILAEHPELSSLELVYMGVVPTARGWGFGLDLARRALWEARRRRRSQMILAVDGNNAPAARIYAALGFQLWDRRGVYIRQRS